MPAQRIFDTDVQTIWHYLVRMARKHTIVTYKDVANELNSMSPPFPLAGCYMAEYLGKALGIISESEDLHGRPLLSSIVINSNNVPELPGQGFFGLGKCIRSGVTRDSDMDYKVHFVRIEQCKVFAEWSL